ncbi:MAG TPA: uracil-DNA glycosylase [bacterium]|nr:uracil-DNA glycosylase [bacterium]HQJ66113.1 uracil-DNA glycosylase [bacterium]
MIMGTGSELQRFLQEQIEIYGDELALELTVLEASRKAPAYPAAPVLPVQAVREIAPLELAKTQRAPLDLQAATLAELHERIGGCLNCAIGHQRKHLVFGTGNPAADIVLVGEAPGYNEDQQGEPFVGEAGQLLNKILAAIRLERSEVYICNLLKCRPTNNRDPLPDEVQNCLPYLEKQLELIQPAFILCLGRFAAQTLLQSTAPLSQLRSQVHAWHGVKLLVTYHPAALLRYPKFKAETWRDVQMLRRLYDEFLAQTLPR